MKGWAKKWVKKRIQISISVEKLAELENFCRENGMSKSGALQYAWTEFLKSKTNRKDNKKKAD